MKADSEKQKVLQHLLVMRQKINDKIALSHWSNYHSARGGEEKLVNRMAIFVFYDWEGYVEDYVRYLLNSLMAVTQKIVIVSNGKLRQEERKKLAIYTPCIYERDNRGFDAGAYKDAFLYYLREEPLDQWDEVILLNDTFYGPVYPWSNVFDKMDKQDVDFWGMTKQEICRWNDNTILPVHVQAYFLAVRKRMLCSESFRLFWEEMEYPVSLPETVLNFEVRFTSFFCQKKFRYTVYTDVCGVYFPARSSDILYIYYIMELLSEVKMPLVKRKALELPNFVKAREVFGYISEHTDYDVDLIKRHMQRWGRNHVTQPFSYWQLDDFCRKHPDFYIYGNGKMGRLVGKYLQWRGMGSDRHIVSVKGEGEGKNVTSYKDAVINKNTGIILALGKKNTAEVLAEIVSDVPLENLLIPNYEIEVLKDVDRR